MVVKKLTLLFSLVYIFSSYADEYLINDAIRDGDVETALTILKNSKDVKSLLNSMKGRTNTPLHRTAEKGDINMGLIFIQYGADIESKDRMWRTPLLSAIYLGHWDFARMLLDRGANIHTTDLEGKGVVAYAILTEKRLSKLEESIRMLLNRGADVDARNKYGTTPLMSASKTADVVAVQALLNNGANVSARDENGRMPIIYAVDVEIGVFNSHKTKENMEQVILMLQRNGADIDARDGSGRTPLMHASERGSYGVDVLLKRGADASVESVFNETALSIAIQKGHQYTGILLLQQSEVGDINARSSTSLGDKTLLMQASEKGDVDLVKEMLARGADVNATIATGQTALDLVILANESIRWRRGQRRGRSRAEDRYLRHNMQRTIRVLRKHIIQQEPSFLRKCSLVFSTR